MDDELHAYLVDSYDPCANLLGLLLQLLGVLYTLRVAPASAQLTRFIPLALILLRIALNRCLAPAPSNSSHR